MNLELPRPQEQAPEGKEVLWNALDRPLVLGFADELGAVFADEEKGELWHLNTNEMIFSKLAETDLSKARAEDAQAYEIEEGKVYKNGAEAALGMRQIFLEDQLQVFRVMKDEHKGGNTAEIMIQAMGEEKELIEDYFAGRESAKALVELGEIYTDMVLPEMEEIDDTLAAK
mgnify:CR=1 FL=1|jgi:hypothetical protein